MHGEKIYLGGKSSSKLSKRPQCASNIYALLLLIQDDGEEGLRSARILYRLRSEKNGISSAMIKNPILRRIAPSLWLVGWIFEEEDYTVDWAEEAVRSARLFAIRQLEEEKVPLLSKEISIEGDELLKLHVSNSEILDKVGEDALYD